jgi:DNA-directed RNA polymerase subunit RPC12/RpoP
MVEINDPKIKKINEFIAKTGIKPSECLYHTWRFVKNKKMKDNGVIRVLVPKSDGIARVEYICPECGHYGYLETEWKRPFFVRCEKCKYKINVPKMREEFKREQKAEQKDENLQ